MLLHHIGLNRVCLFVVEGLNGDQLFAVQAAKQADAAVNGFIANAAILVSGSRDDCTGATVARSAALFGAGKSHFGA